MKNRLALSLPALMVAAAFSGCRQSTVPAVEATATSSKSTRTEPTPRATTAVPHTAVVAATPIVFEDVAAASGIDFPFYSDTVPGRYFLPEVMGGGVGWLDFDLDGRLDLYAVNGCPLDVTPEDRERIASLPPPQPTDRLFRQLPDDRFVDVTADATIAEAEYGQAVAVGDYDADGFPDLYVSNYGPDALRRNNGDGTWSDMTTAAGVAAPRWSSSSAWVDLDGDRLLDLYIATYMDVTPETHHACLLGGTPGYCGPGHYNGVPDRVWRNRGDGTFVAAETELGLTAGSGGKGLAVLAADLDDDLVPEIYVANDMEPNFLFARQDEAASAVYRDVAHESGSAVASDGMNEASMGVACGDFDGDARPDLFLTHYYQAKNTLYRNLGGLLFEDHSRRSGVAALGYDTLGFGTACADFDGDGDLDLVMANGHVLGPEHRPFEMAPQVLANDGTGRFDDASATAGDYFSQMMLGRGLAIADFDDDGDHDVAVSHLDRRLALLQNRSRPAGRFITLTLIGTDRIPPIGGRVRIATDDRRWTIPVTAGGSYLSTSDDRIVVPLGTGDRTVDLAIDWPSGRTSRYDDVPADARWQIHEATKAMLRLDRSGQAIPSNATPVAMTGRQSRSTPETLSDEQAARIRRPTSSHDL